MPHQRRALLRPASALRVDIWTLPLARCALSTQKPTAYAKRGQALSRKEEPVAATAHQRPVWRPPLAYVLTPREERQRGGIQATGMMQCSPSLVPLSAHVSTQRSMGPSWESRGAGGAPVFMRGSWESARGVSSHGLCHSLLRHGHVTDGPTGSFLKAGSGGNPEISSGPDKTGRESWEPGPRLCCGDTGVASLSDRPPPRVSPEAEHVREAATSRFCCPFEHRETQPLR